MELSSLPVHPTMPDSMHINFSTMVKEVDRLVGIIDTGMDARASAARSAWFKAMHFRVANALSWSALTLQVLTRQDWGESLTATQSQEVDRFLATGQRGEGWDMSPPPAVPMGHIPSLVLLPGTLARDSLSSSSSSSSKNPLEDCNLLVAKTHTDKGSVLDARGERQRLAVSWSCVYCCHTLLIIAVYNTGPKASRGGKDGGTAGDERESPQSAEGKQGSYGRSGERQDPCWLECTRGRRRGRVRRR